MCFESLPEKNVSQILAAELPADNKKARTNSNDSEGTIIVKS